MSLEQAYDYPAAAARLKEMGYKVTENWLRDHIKAIPHTKLGHSVTFTETQLTELIAARSRKPADPQPPLRPVTRRRSA